jgi:hypothetical protein
VVTVDCDLLELALKKEFAAGIKADAAYPRMDD